MEAKHPNRSGGMRKGKVSPKSVDEYVSRIPEPSQSMLLKIRAVVRSTLPAEAAEVISYQMPAFKLGKIVVWFAAFQSHCSLFPTAAVMAQFTDELAAYKTSKGTVQFPLDKPLPVALIKKIVRARLQSIGPGTKTRSRKTK